MTGRCSSTNPVEPREYLGEKHRGRNTLRPVRRRRQLLEAGATRCPDSSASAMCGLQRSGRRRRRKGRAPRPRFARTDTPGAAGRRGRSGDLPPACSPLRVPAVQGGGHGRPAWAAAVAPLLGDGDRPGAVAMGHLSADRPRGPRASEPCRARGLESTGAMDDLAPLGPSGPRRSAVAWGQRRPSLVFAGLREASSLDDLVTRRPRLGQRRRPSLQRSRARSLRPIST